MNENPQARSPNQDETSNVTIDTPSPSNSNISSLKPVDIINKTNENGELISRKKRNGGSLCDFDPTKCTQYCYHGHVEINGCKICECIEGKTGKYCTLTINNHTRAQSDP